MLGEGGPITTEPGSQRGPHARHLRGFRQQANVDGGDCGQAQWCPKTRHTALLNRSPLLQERPRLHRQPARQRLQLEGRGRLPCLDFTDAFAAQPGKTGKLRQGKAIGFSVLSHALSNSLVHLPLNLVRLRPPVTCLWPPLQQRGSRVENVPVPEISTKAVSLMPRLLVSQCCGLHP